MFEEHLLLLLLSEQFEILQHPLELASLELPYPVSKLEFHSESIQVSFSESSSASFINIRNV